MKEMGKGEQSARETSRKDKPVMKSQLVLLEA